MANTRSERRTVLWMVAIFIAALLLNYALSTITKSAHGVSADDLTRDQQMVLMLQCVQDAKKMPNYHLMVGEVARTFFEYRTRER